MAGRSFPRGALGVLMGTVLVGLAGCAVSPKAPRSTAGATPASDPDASLCAAYLPVALGARTPVDAMRAEAVLLPFIDLIELGPRQVAERASSAPDPTVASAMRELVGAVDDLDAQGQAQLPTGADPSRAAVRLNPDRLSAALDRADRACAAHAGPGRPGAARPAAGSSRRAQLSRTGPDR